MPDGDSNGDDGLILVINPGSTSTKIAVFRDEECRMQESIRHSREDLARFHRVPEQRPYRRDAILDALAAKGFALERFRVVVSRGGLTRPVSGGVYAIDDGLLDDLDNERHGTHACNLGAGIAREIAGRIGVPAFIADPPTVDEMDPVARYSGHPAITRICIFHALSQKAAARRAAKELGVRYEDANFIVIHMGGGVSIGSHRKGRVVDVNNALDGEGPFSPERTGSLPIRGVAKF